MTQTPSFAPAAFALLSNGRYTVAIDAAGSGFSRRGDIAVTRWREDPTCNPWGSYLLLRDCAADRVVAVGTQPVGASAAATFVRADGSALLRRRDDALDIELRITVADDADAELRRLRITNHSDAAREIDVTSYAELVLGSAGGDDGHPAFSKLFVQTDWVAEHGLLLATRRRRGPDEALVWAGHFAVVEGDAAVTTAHETDRARFLGRGRTLHNAAAMQAGGTLSETVGCVLDPVFSLRRGLRLAAGASVDVAFWTVLADARDTVIAFAAAHAAGAACEAVFAAAAAREAALFTRLSIDAASAQRHDALLAPLLQADRRWRAPQAVLARAAGGPATLQAVQLSGRRALIVLRMSAAAQVDVARDLLAAQRYYRARGFGVDVALLNTADGNAADALHAVLEALVVAHTAIPDTRPPAAAADLVLLRETALADAARDALYAFARIVLDGADGEIGVPPSRASLPVDPDAARAETLPRPSAASPGRPLRPRALTTGPLEFANGLGGFSEGGRAYDIDIGDGVDTPAPWINVVANPHFGFIASASGGGYTWSVNSQQNPLTPWPNDPVTDMPREAIYLRDEASGDVWSATALPIRVPGVRYRARHGKGFSQFSHVAHGIACDVLLHVPVDDAVKLSRVRLHNPSPDTRHLSVTAFAQWALGANGSQPAPFVVTERDAATGALLARNRWRPEYAERVAFADLDGRQTSWTADRTEFLGRDGAMDRPAALASPAPLSGRVGAGLDPCAALQAALELRAGESVEVVFLLGDAASDDEARALIAKYRQADLDAVLDATTALWSDALDAVQVRTPDRAMDIVLNGWLLYQTLACRVWARTAYYQASGAYGFRDQLQDVMALAVARPDLVREHLVRAAARQFVEGDVQHWWLPPAGQGIRTRMTDDRVWLAYVAMHYIAVTGDAAVLDADAPFLTGKAVPDGEHEAFFLPDVAAGSASVYEHCARGIDISLSLGAHGLPLIGTGDWNDGMNRVGEAGRGESTWLAWLLLATIGRFAPIAEQRGDGARAAHWRDVAARIGAHLETTGWDGAWYRRGYYDDGTPLGAAESTECRIDAIAQSWSVMAGVADPGHAATAMASVDEHLIDRRDRIAMLFTPPFDKTAHDPGYIKGYPPGIRENGGQYTHGAIWSVFAFAGLGDGDKAAELFAILNPVLHADNPAAVARYKVEPYAACADVYSVAPHAGRGGWTWYTGSAGWLYRAGTEAILGFDLRGDVLRITPCIPRDWPGFAITYRRRAADGRITPYEIAVENPRGVQGGVASVAVDDVPLADPLSGIALVHDGATHRVRVVLG